MTPTRREETTDLETEVVAALYLIEELHRSGSYAGSVDDLRTLQQRVKHRLPTKLVLTLLRWRATNLHPTYGSGVKEWLFRLDAILTDFLDVRNETRENVRADAFELLHEAHWFARYDAEAVNALIDRVLIPRIQSIDATRDAGLNLRAITMVTEVARQLHEQAGSIFLSGVVDADTPRAAVLLAGQLSERFDALVAMLESALRSANATSQHIAATCLLDKDDPKRFKVGTPEELSRTMERVWMVSPSSEEIVRDIKRFPKALARIIECKGAKVPELDTRHGRRET
jgi:hypothetical protein